MRNTKQVGYDEALHSALDMWLLMKLQAYLYRERLLLPEEVDLTNVWSVLDVACGSGQWVRDMATWLQGTTIVGLDRQEEVIEQARHLSDIWRLGSTSFLVGDMFHMDALADNSFDLVHARFLAPSVAPQQWPALLHECLRVCRSGGTLIWTEAAFPTTNSLTCQQWWQLMQQAIFRLGTTPDVTPYMHRLLRDVDSAANMQVRRLETVLDFSVEAPFHTRLYRHISPVLDATKPLLLQTHVATLQELDSLCQRIIIDLYSDSFQGVWTLTTMLVEKV